MKIPFRFLMILLLLSTNLTACSYYKNHTRSEDCDRVLKSYNRQYVRFKELEKAAIVFVDRPIRDSYSIAAEEFRRKNVSLVDVRVLAQECLAEQKRAEATVEFDYFILPDSRLKTVTDRQKWIFREEDKEKPELGEGWKLVTPLPAFK
jgi:hypothetical protein